jgi:thiamine biosynthesis lipoprotein
MTAMTGSATPPGVLHESRAMGSPLRLTLGGTSPPEPNEASRAWLAVVEAFERAEAAMSRFRDDSELTALNRSAGSGTVARPSWRLRVALAAADRAHRVATGRFDPRVLAELDRLGYRGAALGAPVGTVDGRRPRSEGSDRIVRPTGRRGRSIEHPIDLGGIGKGLTLRWAADLLRARAADDFLLEAGGDLVARGLSPDGGRWQVGIEDPTDVAAQLAVIAVADEAIATSSVRVHRWTIDGRPAHHLLDPATGEPAAGGLSAVTVAGPDPAWAEVWSKVLFIGGLDRIAAEARSRGLAAWWVADDGTLAMTAAARARTVWVAAEAG